MRRVLVALALTFTMTFIVVAQDAEQQTSSQLRFGVKAGYHLSTLNYEGLQGAIEPLRSWTVGGVVEYPLSQSFFVGSGLELMSKGSMRENSAGSITYNPIYLQIPVTVNFMTSNWNVGIGPYFGYGVMGNETISVAGVSVTQSIVFDDNNEDATSPFDIGVCAQVGYSIEQFRFGAYLYNSISNTLPTVARTDDTYTGNFVFGFSASYYF